MNTKAITLTIVFAALTVALNPELTKIFFPAPYAPFLIYQIWEIPIVAAFLLINPKSAIAIAALNSVILLAIFQGASPLGPFYNLAAILSMLLGIYVAHKLFSKRLSPERTTGSTWKYNTALAIVYTALGVAFRAGIMGALNYVVLRYPMPIGYGLGEASIVGYFLPVTTIFNATLALYTIPLGYFIAEVVKRNFRHTQNAA
jgi:riboflavin transporter FmnP